MSEEKLWSTKEVAAQVENEISNKAVHSHPCCFSFEPGAIIRVNDLQDMEKITRAFHALQKFALDNLDHAKRLELADLLQDYVDARLEAIQ